MLTGLPHPLLSVSSARFGGFDALCARLDRQPTQARGNRATQSCGMGVTSEAEAIKTFTAKIHLRVVETSAWLDESSVLGASPDGFMGEHACSIEAKCSYTFRNASIKEALKSETFCLEKKEDGSHSLKRNHVY